MFPSQLKDVLNGVQNLQCSCALLSHVPNPYLVPGSVLGTVDTETLKDIGLTLNSSVQLVLWNTSAVQSHLA